MVTRKRRCDSVNYSSLASSWVPFPIWLGSGSPSPYKVARHKSPTGPRTMPNNSSFAGKS